MDYALSRPPVLTMVQWSHSSNRSIGNSLNTSNVYHDTVNLTDLRLMILELTRYSRTPLDLPPFDLSPHRAFIHSVHFTFCPFRSSFRSSS